ncbi:acyltransferase family protein [Pseudomonas sp. LRF_L74]|uniref:acyltransferase family protein n=1 Tax=Pseudomonas sp. LRF_L74 TaxID=3369422 RepID=UPI003F613B90
MTTEKQRFIGLEWLRFLMGLYVAIYHTIHLYYPAKGETPLLDELTSMGFFATSTFFVLSGFLLAHVYLNNGEMREPARSFWLKRFANLYPIHIFALLLALGMVVLLQWMGDSEASARFVIIDTNELIAREQPELFHHWMSNGEMALNLFLQFTMLQAWNPYYLTFNAPLWSISALFFFYLTFPLLAPRLMRVRHPLWALLLTGLLYLIPPLLVILHQDYGAPYTGIIQRLPLVRLPEFVAGILLYAIFSRQQAAGKLPGTGQRWLLALFSASSFALGASLFVHGAKYWYYLLHNGLLLPAELVLVYLAALARDPNSAWLRHWSPRLGAASLSIFALHVPISSLFRTLEKLLVAHLPSCPDDLATCRAAAESAGNSLTGYVIFLAMLVAISVVFQERMVVPVRRRLIKTLQPLVVRERNHEPVRQM